MRGLLGEVGPHRQGWFGQVSGSEHCGGRGKVQQRSDSDDVCLHPHCLGHYPEEVRAFFGLYLPRICSDLGLSSPDMPHTQEAVHLGRDVERCFSLHTSLAQALPQVPVLIFNVCSCSVVAYKNRVSQRRHNSICLVSVDSGWCPGCSS